MRQNSNKNISIIIIGLNVGETLQSCIESVHRSSIRPERTQIIYVDSGSTDRSLEIARSYKHIRVLQLQDPAPNAAKARNLGARYAEHEILQFVDADSFLHPAWLNAAAMELGEDVQAVTGKLIERYPHRNFFHRMTSYEWDLHIQDGSYSVKGGPTEKFSGNVMMTASAFNQLGGYDEHFKAGEDPELSIRFRHAGYVIMRLSRPMASHDINMDSWSQYFRRTRRTGAAYTDIAAKHSAGAGANVLRPLFRITVANTAPLTAFALPCSPRFSPARTSPGTASGV